MNLQVLPLEFFNSTNGAAPPPRDPHLFEAVQNFCKEEFGEERQFHNHIKAWVAVEQVDSGYAVQGIVSLRNRLECDTFHIRTGGDSKGERDQAKAVRNMLLMRAVGSIQDTFGRGAAVLVFVDPKADRFWRGFLRLIGAKFANRYEVQV